MSNTTRSTLAAILTFLVANGLNIGVLSLLDPFFKLVSSSLPLLVLSLVGYLAIAMVVVISATHYIYKWCGVKEQVKVKRYRYHYSTYQMLPGGHVRVDGIADLTFKIENMGDYGQLKKLIVEDGENSNLVLDKTTIVSLSLLEEYDEVRAE